MKVRLSRLVTGLIAVVLASLCQAKGIEMSWEQVWPNVASGSICPIRITLENTGQDDRGIVKVETDRSSMTYPFELPASSEKSFIAYVSKEPYVTNLQVTLNSRGTNVTIPINLLGNSNNLKVVGMISQNPGELSFVAKTQQAKDFIEQSGATVKPQMAPDRAIGYWPLSILFLGEGSERLTDSEVSAIKHWVMMGGTLVFNGGSLTPIFNDPRWAGVTPLTNCRATSAPAPSVLKLQETITLVESTLAPGAGIDQTEGGRIVQARRGYGLGTVVALSYNMFEGPLRKWEGRSSIVQRLIKLSDQKKQNLQRTINPGNILDSFDSNGYGSLPSTFTGDPIEGSPFQAKLPDMGQVFLILFLFWLVVVPVHFFILGKMNRRDLAWFTAPLISIGFASIFFTFAKDLYSASLSRQTSGNRYFAAGEKTGIFEGNQQFFFPRFGSHEMKMENVEAIIPKIAYDEYYSPNLSAKDFSDQFIDVDGVRSPNFVTGSLEFKETGIVQSVELTSKFKSSFKATQTGSKVIVEGSITYSGKETLKNTSIAFGFEDHASALGEIKPGVPNQFKFVLNAGKNVLPHISPILSGYTKGDDVGVQIGKLVESQGVRSFISMGTVGVTQS